MRDASREFQVRPLASTRSRLSEAHPDAGRIRDGAVNGLSHDASELDLLSRLLSLSGLVLVGLVGSADAAKLRLIQPRVVPTPFEIGGLQFQNLGLVELPISFCLR
ncbi:hypothetical protein QTI33_11670 [Variovorax sp. J22P271]|uniref:hypothetical protein n=1 Tax=Variovorax davisae TaxID=3053515 RepID=UPI0025752485|nr:hypothetical protein [Variovorax sp. J22P271]MDM0032782.1 hypothetical protein [Variovorax sp. J22P271]